MLKLREGRDVCRVGRPQLYAMVNLPWVYWTKGRELPGNAYYGGNSYIVRRAADWGTDNGIMNAAPREDDGGYYLVSINGCGETRWYAKVPRELSEIDGHYWQGSASDTREALDYFFEEVQ